MGNRSGRRRKPSKRTLIGPLVMLAGGMAVGVIVWHVLMLDPGPGWRTVEQLSGKDRDALERVLTAHP
jgi:hypothetical protein